MDAGAGRRAHTVAAFAVLALAACPGPGAGIGETCAASSECAEALQCLEGICTPACQHHVECGDGYQCAQGACRVVSSRVGDRCEREIDCGPAQTCALDAGDPDLDGRLAGTCQPQSSGLVAGAACSEDAACQSSNCSVGLCTQLCQVNSDCPPAHTCALVPRLLPDAAPTFSGCLPTQGVAVDRIALDAPSATVRVPVPSTARSFALVARIGDPDQLVGATRVVAPDGRVLYATPVTPDDFYRNRLRYQPAFAVSALLVPNTPAIDLQVGAYEIEVSSLLPIGGRGTAVPEVTVLYKLDVAASLDLHLHFLDLTDHPCASAFDGARLDAASAQSSPQFQGYLAAVDAILAPSGVRLGSVTYTDIEDRGDLDAIGRDRLGALLSLASEPTGVHVFLVRSMSPAGVQAMVGGTPGPPRTPATPASGVAIAVDTLCYRSWEVLARITAHAVARQMGLYYNRAPDGAFDTIPDSDGEASNLMFFGDFGGTVLSDGQREVLRRYPGLR